MLDVKSGAEIEVANPRVEDGAVSGVPITERTEFVCPSGRSP